MIRQVRPSMKGTLSVNDRAKAGSQAVGAFLLTQVDNLAHGLDAWLPTIFLTNPPHVGIAIGILVGVYFYFRTASKLKASGPTPEE